jgi:hypothetical protein
LKNVCEHGVQIIKNAEDVKLHRRTSARWQKGWEGLHWYLGRGQALHPQKSPWKMQLSPTAEALPAVNPFYASVSLCVWPVQQKLSQGVPVKIK